MSEPLAESADLAVLKRMLLSAMTGVSALSVLKSDCPYATIKETAVILNLSFYVWVSNLDLDYELTSNQGHISNSTRVRLHKEFDIMFKGSEKVELPFIFEGTYTKQMPVFNAVGKELIRYTVEERDAELLADQAINTMFRARGTAIGYKHTITVSLTKEDVDKVQKVENVVLVVTATWLDEEEEEQSTQLTLDIPDCARKMLEFCEEDNLSKGSSTCVGNCDDEPILNVYYSTCEPDVVIDEIWERNS